MATPVAALLYASFTPNVKKWALSLRSAAYFRRYVVMRRSREYLADMDSLAAAYRVRDGGSCFCLGSAFGFAQETARNRAMC